MKTAGNNRLISATQVLKSHIVSCKMIEEHDGQLVGDQFITSIHIKIQPILVAYVMAYFVSENNQNVVIPQEERLSLIFKRFIQLPGAISEDTGPVGPV